MWWTARASRGAAASVSRLLINAVDSYAAPCVGTTSVKACGGTVLSSQTHREGGRLLQRIAYRGGDGDAAAAAVRETLEAASVAVLDRRKRVALFAGPTEHAAREVLERAAAGRLEGDVVLMVSNHAALSTLAEAYEVPFRVIETPSGASSGDAAARRASAEDAARATLNDFGVDVVALARYMQVLSGAFCEARPVINVHHALLPAFPGARPYARAYDRGVKLIGATAHYATAELDAGPIIAQAAASVSHADDAKALARIGSRLESQVLGDALAAHLEDRLIVNAGRVAVFDRVPRDYV